MIILSAPRQTQVIYQALSTTLRYFELRYIPIKKDIFLFSLFFTLG